MYLLAVSGGPDSMFLLEQYRHHPIIVAHVNYQTQPTSADAELIVRNYCQKWNIKFFVLHANIDKKSGNFQNKARQIRYQFFQKIYADHNCQQLITGHHKDDFLETALFQSRSGRNPEYWGIKNETYNFNMNIARPLIAKFWKKDILKNLHIEYYRDPTNQSTRYERNRIRHEIKTWTQAQKIAAFKKFAYQNQELAKLNKAVEKSYQAVVRHDFSLAYLQKITNHKLQLIHKIVTKKFTNVRLSQNKMRSLWQFIEASSNNKKFIIDDHHLIIKNNGKLQFLKQ